MPRLRANADHVVHGEEKRLVAQLGDEGELALDGIPDFFRDAPGKALLQPFLGELAQPARWGLALGDQLLGVFVAQLVE